MAAFTAVDDPGLFFESLLYTGDGSADRALTGAGFQPDWVVMKNRDSAYNWETYDAVRGVEENINWNQTYAQATHTYGVKTFDSDGFTIGTANDATNGNTIAYVAYNWKAGTTTGIATSGSETITPSGYSFNQTAGCSIIAYTGDNATSAVLPHGLGAVPGLIIIKSLAAVRGWRVYQQGCNAGVDPKDEYMVWNDTDAEQYDVGMWNGTAPDSVNFHLGTDNEVNAAEDYIAYLFAGKNGYSKFGFYAGNNSADGTFVYTGFKPAMIIIKNVTGDAWFMYDNKRMPFNYSRATLKPNSDAAEQTGTTNENLNILSNGFKLTYNTGGTNDAVNYIYMAWAESPFVNSKGAPTNAR